MIGTRRENAIVRYHTRMILAKLAKDLPPPRPDCPDCGAGVGRNCYPDCPRYIEYPGEGQ